MTLCNRLFFKVIIISMIFNAYNAESQTGYAKENSKKNTALNIPKPKPLFDIGTGNAFVQSSFCE